MNCLVLLPLLIVFFCCGRVSPIEKLGHLMLDTKYGKCPGNQPHDLREPMLPNKLIPQFWMVVTTDKDGVIEHIATIVKKDGTKMYELNPKSAPYDKNMTGKKIHLLMFVPNKRDEMMTGLDNQIFYGYDPTKVWNWDFKKHPEKPTDQLGDDPFRISEINVAYIPPIGNPRLIFRAVEKSCNNKDDEAWIANHGLYWVGQRQGSLAPYFTNIYYWPQLGRVFTYEEE